VKVTATVALTSGQTAGLVTRYGGPLESNLYLGQLFYNGTNVQGTIWKNLGGTYTLLTVGPTTTTTTSGTFEFESVGPSLKVIFGGTLLAFADDTSLTTGSVGMRLGQNVAMDNFHAEAVIQQQASLPFDDHFNNSDASDGSQLSRFWTDQSGNISVINNQASGGAAGNSVSTVNGLNQADVAVTANVTLTSGQTVGLVTRYGGPLESNLYLGQLSYNGTNVQATIWENLSGTYYLLTVGQTTSTQTSGSFEFETVGASLKVIFGGNLLAFANNTTLTSGSVGMRLGHNATMDDFHAEAVMLQTPSLAPPGFKDTFGSVSSGNQLDRNWSDQIGNITVVNSKATGEAPGNNNLSTLNGVNVINSTVQASIALTSGQVVGLVSRYSGPLDSNYYLGQLSFNGTNVQATIWKNIGGTYTLLTTTTTALNGTGTLKFVTSGSSLQVFLDTTLLASLTDTSITAGGSVGMRLGQNVAVSEFDASSP
jgi:hypothetical protein